jgi:hypothetical protein
VIKVPPTEATRELHFPTLLDSAIAGEPDALSEIFRAYQPRLLRYLRAQEPGMADDLAAEVWRWPGGSAGSGVTSPGSGAGCSPSPATG